MSEVKKIATREKLRQGAVEWAATTATFVVLDRRSGGRHEGGACSAKAFRIAI